MSFPFKKSVKNLLDWIVDKLLPSGQRGQIPVLKNDSEVDRENSWIVIDGNFVTTPEERAAAMNNRPSNEEVFNSWGRFAHYGTDYSYTNPSGINEETVWIYDAANDRVVCTYNTYSHSGFYSRAKYDNYYLEARLSSTNQDDDMIGIVIAFAIDENGDEHTLTAYRSAGGVTGLWGVSRNYGLSSSALLVNKSAGITDPTVNWSAAGSCKVKVRRTGNVIEAWTTQFGSEDFLETHKITIDLSSDPNLAVFRGPKAYGFSCHSQEASTFSDIKFLPQGDSILHNYIFDLTENRVFVPREDGSFEEVWGYDVLDTIGPGKYIRDRTSSKMWFITGEMNLLPLGKNMDKAGGDLYKKYPNPMVKKIQGNEVAEGVPARKGDVLRWETDGPTPKWVPERVSHIQGRKIKDVAPLNKQSLAWSTTENMWIPQTIGGGLGDLVYKGKITGSITVPTGGHDSISSGMFSPISFSSACQFITCSNCQNRMHGGVSLGNSHVINAVPIIDNGTCMIAVFLKGTRTSGTGYSVSYTIYVYDVPDPEE